MNRLYNFLKIVIIVTATFSLSSCGSSGSGSSTNSSIPPVSYCSTVSSYTSPITISGTAQYQYRANGNGAVAGPNPIRYAEIRVKNSAGSIIQCGETNSSGQFSLQLPADSSTATIEVTSRASNSFANVYVLNNPTSNEYHSVSTDVVLDATKNVGALTAPATGTLEGGAFNILDQIVNANDFLRTQTANCNVTFSACTPFSVTSLLTVYWDKGVNPGTYFGQPALSFYLPDYKQLFILGGSGGDVDSSDTDHFDNTIILHEFGHFLEDSYAKIDSPGGVHNGNSIIDPRLAWGEGFANYFQAVVTGNYVYRDTFGTPEGTSGVFINENLETGSTDIASTLGEGNFREFSITRALVDITDSTNEGSGVDQLTAPFSEFWTVFTSETAGLKNSNHSFRNVGLLYSLQSSLSGGSNWSEIQGAENHKSNEQDYANTLTLGGSCSAISIQAANISMSQQEDGTPANSNQFASNDFYKYVHSGGTLSVNLNYNISVPASPGDLDLYIYQNEYTFGSASSVAASSTNDITVGASTGSESIVTSLSAGTYMINVNVNTRDRLGSSSTYTLTINGQQACPN